MGGARGRRQGGDFLGRFAWHRSCSLRSMRSGSQPYTRSSRRLGRGPAGREAAPPAQRLVPPAVPRSSPPHRPQRVVDRFPEVLDRMGADQTRSAQREPELPRHDHEGRRGVDAQVDGQLDVVVDLPGELAPVKAAREGGGVQPDVGGVLDQPGPLEGGLAGVEAVVVGPVASRGPRAARPLVGPPGEGVAAQRQVLVDQADLARVLLQDLVQRPLDPLAEGSLVVGELHDGDGGVGRALDHGGIHVDLALTPGREGRQEQQHAQRGRDEPGAGGQAARPSSDSAVMM